MPTECPVVLYETQIGSLVFLETGTSLRTRIDNINEENAILDDLVLMSCGTVAAVKSSLTYIQQQEEMKSVGK